MSNDPIEVALQELMRLAQALPKEAPLETIQKCVRAELEKYRERVLDEVTKGS